MLDGELTNDVLQMFAASIVTLSKQPDFKGIYLCVERNETANVKWVYMQILKTILS